MTRNITIFIFVTLSLLTSCNGQRNNQDKYENAVCDCFSTQFDSLGIDLNSALFQFEEHLVETKQLTDFSGDSYYEIFENIALEGFVPSYNENTINEFTSNNFEIYLKCFFSQINNPSLEKNNSKLKSIYDDFKKLANTQNIDSKPVSELILKTLNAKDFEKEIYRTFALYTLYHSTTLDSEDGKVIHIDVNKNEEIRLNDELILVDSIASKINEITLDYSISEKERFIVSLTAGKEVNMRVISNIKLQVRQANILRLHYDTSSN